MQHRASLSFVIPAVLALLGGCIIVPGNGTGGTGGSGAFTVSSSSSSSGEGGQGGAGGQAGGVGVGGGSNCVSGPGLKDIKACDSLNTQGVLCGVNMDVPALANDVCVRGSAIYQGVAFDMLHSCFQNIEKVDACVEKPVTDCLGEIYKSTCPNSAVAACDSIATKICGVEPFDTQGCVLDTIPLNDKALQVLADCISGTDPNVISCQDAYTDCFNKLTTFCEPGTPDCVPLRAPRPNTF